MIDIAQAAEATILIVDDTPANLDMAVEFLEAHGFRVLVAQDGDEGISRAKLTHPDLILLDVMMPGINGIETCKLLMAGEATRNIPVIFMTALTDIDSKITGFEAGGVDYLTKPLEMEEVLARINTHLCLARTRSTLQEKNRLLAQEIAERQKIEAELCQVFARQKESEERYRLLVELSSDAILIAEDGKVTFANRAALSLFHATDADDLKDRSLLSLVAPEGRENVEAILQGLEPGSACHVHDEQALTLDGKVCEVTVSRVAFKYQGKPLIQIAMHDITERVQLTQQLQHQATHDPLTGLPNRLLLMDRLQQMIGQAQRQQERFSVCFIDLDHFKWINDTYGHEAGDEVLRTVSRRISTVLRKSDTLARLGGDEFVLALHEPGSADEFALILNRIATAVAEPIPIAGREITVSCSMGCCAYPEHGKNTDELLRFADKAMYRIKKTQQQPPNTKPGALDERQQTGDQTP